LKGYRQGIDGKSRPIYTPISWHADHICKHDPNAIECFLPIGFLACNIFHAFVMLNLKPEIRGNRTRIFWRRFMAAEIYAGIDPAISP